MKKGVFLSLVALCCSLPLHALHKKDVPESVSAAKTIYVINETESEKVGDDAYRDLEQWGKYQVVHERKGADLILHFKQGQWESGGQSHATFYMYVTAGDSDDRLFERHTHFVMGAGSIARGNIDAFRKWVEGK